MTPGVFSGGTTLADAVHNNNLWAPAFAADMNARNQQIFDGAVANYNLNMRSGQKHDPPLVPPVAPFMYVTSPPDENGFIWPVLSTTVRMAPTVPIATVDLGTLTVPTRDASHIDVGAAIPGGNGIWFSVGPLDGTPNGFMTPPTTSADGVFGIFQKFGAPVGAGWYAKQK